MVGDIRGSGSSLLGIHEDLNEEYSLSLAVDLDCGIHSLRMGLAAYGYGLPRQNGAGEAVGANCIFEENKNES